MKEQLKAAVFTADNLMDQPSKTFASHYYKALFDVQ